MEARQVKKLYIILVSVSMILLTGCMKAYPLSETETDAVSEYMAGLILKYDKNYSPSLLSYNEVSNAEENGLIQDEKVAAGTYEPLEDEKVAAETDGEGNVNDDKKNDNNINNENINKDKENKDETGNNSTTQSKEDDYSITEIIGDSDFDVQYTGYKLVDTYPEDETNQVFSVDPRMGYRLLVLNFSVENITDKDKTIDLVSDDIKLILNINNNEMLYPQLTLLENNLQFIKMDIKANEKITAVVIFEVPEDMELTDMSLTVSKDSMTKEIVVK